MLYLKRGVFVNIDAVFFRGKQNDAACLTYVDGCCHVAVEEQLLHRHTIDGVTLYYGADRVVDLLQSVFEKLMRLCYYRAVFDCAVNAALAVDNAVAHGCKSGVDTENYHDVPQNLRKSYSIIK